MRLLFIGGILFLFSCKKDTLVYYDIDGDYIGKSSSSFLQLDTITGEYSWGFIQWDDSITISDYNFEDSTFILKDNDNVFELKYNPITKQIIDNFPLITNGVIRNDTISYGSYQGHTSSSGFQGFKQY